MLARLHAALAPIDWTLCAWQTCPRHGPWRESHPIQGYCPRDVLNSPRLALEAARDHADRLLVDVRQATEDPGDRRELDEFLDELDHPELDDHQPDTCNSQGQGGTMGT